MIISNTVRPKFSFQIFVRNKFVDHHNLDCLAMKLDLDFSSIKHVEYTFPVKDFAFIIGKQSFKCTKYFASIVSRKIQQSIQMDCTFDRYVSKYIGKNTIAAFSEIIKIYQGENIPISKPEIITQIAQELECIELLKKIQKDIIPSNIEKNNVMDRILFKSGLSENINQEIQYVAANLQKFNSEELSKLSPELFELVISSPSLAITDEGRLLSILDSLPKEYWYLLRHVHVSYLSQVEVRKYIDMLSSIELDNMIWNEICSRLVLDVHVTSSNSRIVIKKRPKYEPNDFFYGILRSQKQSYTIKSSKLGNHQRLIDDENTDNIVIRPDNNGEAWISFNFKSMIEVFAYTIKSGRDNDNMKSWVLEGKNEQDDYWNEIDRKDNSSELQEKNCVKTFKVKNELITGYNEVRLRINDTFSSKKVLQLTRIEFFGNVL